MGQFAHISAGAIANIVIGDQASDLPVIPAGDSWVQVDELVPIPAIGWSYANGKFARPPGPAIDLVAYANTKQWAVATGGYTATVGGQALTFATDIESQALITGKALRLQQPSPPASVDWQLATGFMTLATADFITVAVDIADFVQATFDTLKTVLAEIAAGTITTTAEIDAASWPKPSAS